MTTPQALHHSLLRPCVLHILRAAGYHVTRSSILDFVTDLAAKYMLLLAQKTLTHSILNDGELEISIQDVRMAMQDMGALAPERLLEDQEFDGEEDTRGMDAFITWAMGKENGEIRRIALEEGEGVKEDYLTVLKKKHSTTDEETRYTGTMLGKAAEPRTVKVEGGDISSVKEWAKRRKTTSKSVSSVSTRQSSILSSLGDEDVEEMEF